MRALKLFAFFMLISFIVFKFDLVDKSNQTQPAQQTAQEDKKELLPPTKPVGIKTLNKAAVAQFSKNAWIKDLYIYADILNVGVIATEKQWQSPMIGAYVCTVLKDNNIALRVVRFVDIEKIYYQKKTPRAAEIYSFECV